MKKYKLGVSFSDFVVQDFSAKKSRVREEGGRDYRRGWLVWVGVVVAFGMLLVRLGVLQLMSGGTYRVLADENRIRQVKVAAPRGIIYDRNGTVLAGNLTSTASKQGVEIEVWKREYPAREASGHVVGYLSEVNPDEVGLLKQAGQKYDAGDLIGRMGLEQYYEKKLHGIDGGRLVEVDNLGEIVRQLGIKAPVPGENLNTSLDAGISQTAMLGLKNKKGAVVVSRPKTGEILALLSSPGFDPNLFIGSNENNQILNSNNQTNSNLINNNDQSLQNILNNKDLPLFNRAISGAYPPGSTFKMVTTSAAIDSGRVRADFSYNDTGVITIGNFSYSNWLFSKKGATEGQIGFTRALIRSTDTFFYQIAAMTTPEVIGEWANKFGYGSVTGIDIFGEVPGLVATPIWKEQTLGERWFLGNTYHMGIGQGDLLATPLQVNLMTNIIANGGKMCRPQLLADSGVHCTDVPLSETVKKIVMQGMIGACSPDGTAFPLFDWNEAGLKSESKSTYAERESGEKLPVIACKTGTAEYVAENGRMRTHAWLTAFAPADDPQISVTVLLEGGGEGSNAAAPVARQVLAKFFEVIDTYPYDRIPQEVGE